LSDFKVFAEAVHDRYNAMKRTAGEFFVVDIPDLFEVYVNSFPEGTNPIFRKRTEHDCNTCKHFIQNLGKVVTIKSGEISTVWDVENIPAPYDVVAKTLSDKVRQAPITSVFRTQYALYGSAKNVDNHDPGITWYHFHGEAPAQCVTNYVGTAKGKVESIIGVFRRGLNEILQSDLDIVLDLIKQNAIYRGKEFEKTVKEFKKLQLKYQKEGCSSTFAWEHCRNSAAGFRNTVIGSLFIDLSCGDDIEVAVKKFEAKVAPANYKRPTSLITPKMIEQAVDKLKELGLEDAVERRLACIEDLNINDILFVDNSVASKMKGGVADLLLSSASVKKTRSLPKNPTKISITDFIKAKHKSIELILSGEHVSNFATITAPVHSAVKQLFKWKNSFAWSYDGEVADTMREIVTSRGGRVDGVFRFTHQWNYDKRNASLMDLHVFMPGASTDNHRDGCHDNYPTNRRVGWNYRSDSRSGGVQDVDYTDAAPTGYVPIENITFPDLSKMPEGKYVCKIHNWSLRSPTQGGFKAEIEFGGEVFQYEVDRPLKRKEWVTVAEVTLHAGKFTIEHKLPVGSLVKEKWGITTNTPVKVQTILLSPNHWEGAGSVGNKHWFFILEDCLNPEPARGLYCEFLRSDLDPHRKVFEVLASRTKCQPTNRQLSGVGFSETRSDVVTAIADGRPYNIVF
jgi:hypothetical protein